MNNNMNFDPMTGLPTNNQVKPVEPITSEGNVGQTVNSEAAIQSQLQSIPTVEQDKQAFIENVQSMNQEKKEEKKEGVNFIFIIILCIIILASIYFLFPLLAKYV